MEELRLGFVGIVVDQRQKAGEVNAILSQYGDMIRGRIGIPDQEQQRAVIGLVVEGTNDRVGAMTGKLGNIPGVTVKSAMTKSGKSPQNG
ncbi:MAG: CopG family transcriptional regulator [Clostridiales bacterium]|nr:CopG family transcriptional regulator [Clostridiales bacterium]